MNTRRLTRSQDNKMIAGVCGGLAEYLAIDVTLVRLLFVLLLLLGGHGLLVYVILWIIMPQAGQPLPAPRITNDQPSA